MIEQNRYDSLFRFYAEASGLDWRAVKAQAMAESALDPKAVSVAGARGLMQFMPLTWEEWARGEHPFDVEQSIRAGCRYMRWLLRYLGDGHGVPTVGEEQYERALAAYNWGIGNVSTAIRSESPWRAQLPSETRSYLVRIRSLYSMLTTPVHGGQGVKA